MRIAAVARFSGAALPLSLFPDSAAHMNAVRSSIASHHVLFAVVFRFPVIRCDDNGMAALIRNQKSMAD
jgi:hypothetical protein